MTQPRSRLPRILLALALGTLLGALLCEAGARVVLRARGKPYDSAAAQARLAALAQGMRAFVPQDEVAQRRSGGGPLPDLAVLQHPYTGYDVYKGYTEFQRDRVYFTRGPGARGATVPAGPSGAGEPFDVLLLGGSVAAQFGESKQGAGRLVELLRARSELGGRPVRVFTYARMGFRQPQSCTQLAFLLAAGFAPDAVVLLDGFNDVALSCNNAHNGVFPLFPSTSHWGFLLRSPFSNEGALPILARVAEHTARSEQGAQRALDGGWQHSALLGSVALDRALAERTRAYDAQKELEALSKGATRGAAETGLGFDGDAASAVAVAVHCWSESTRSMRAMLAERGIAYVHALQPALHDAGGAKPLSADERAASAIDAYWLEGVQLGYPLLRAASAELATRGQHVLDLSTLFRGVETSLYTDYCHLNGSGNELVAQALAAAVATSLK
jgi:hypothetical protein